MFQKAILAFFLFFFGLADGTGALAQAPSPLALSLTVNRTDAYLVGEPVLLSFHLTNISDKPVSVQTDAELEADLRIQVRTPMTRPWSEVKKPFPSISFPTRPYELLPLETRSYSIILLYDRQNRDLPEGAWPKLIFDQESFFRIKVQLSLGFNNLQKMYLEKETDIEVKAPVQNSPEDLVLGGLLLRVEGDKLIFQKRQMEAYQLLKATDTETRKFFEYAVESVPVNRYTPWFLYLLGNSYDSLKAQERAKAINAYERLIRDFPSFPLIDGVFSGLAKIYDDAGEGDKAYAMIQQLIHAKGPDEELMKSNLGEYLSKGMDYEPNYWMLVQ